MPSRGWFSHCHDPRPVSRQNGLPTSSLLLKAHYSDSLSNNVTMSYSEIMWCLFVRDPHCPISCRKSNRRFEHADDIDENMAKET